MDKFTKPSSGTFLFHLFTMLTLGVQQRDSDIYIHIWASQVLLVVKNPPASSRDVRDVGSIPGSGRSPGGGLGNPPQYSCLGNPTNRGAWQVTVHRLVKRQK